MTDALIQLTDFGLSKRLSAGTQATRSGRVLGTLVVYAAGDAWSCRNG